MGVIVKVAFGAGVFQADGGELELKITGMVLWPVLSDAQGE